jgi:hypothetical protein
LKDFTKRGTEGEGKKWRLFDLTKKKRWESSCARKIAWRREIKKKEQKNRALSLTRLKTKKI